MRAFAWFFVFVLACLPVPASAQGYPNRPIRVITAGTAGGTPEVFMRELGEELRKRIGQPFVIENRPGGTFRIGAQDCAKAAPDGYTICILSNDALVYDQFLYKRLPYNLEKDFAPVTNAFFATQVLVVNAKLKVKNLDELAALSRQKPGTLSYIAPGLPFYVYMENFKKRTGADMVRVPFSGGGEIINSVLSGATPIAISGLSYWMPYLENGMVTGLAVDSAKRLTALPNVPTFAELGHTSHLTRIYFGIVAPAGTPRPSLELLYHAIAQVMADPNFREKYLTSRGLEPVANSPDEFAAFLAKDRAVSKRTVQEAGIEPQ
jgi:tripartite-type tricarboxylate transporter receptor subunit TctC